jgi:hypothetical protein
MVGSSAKLKTRQDSKAISYRLSAKQGGGGYSDISASSTKKPSAVAEG